MKIFISHSSKNKDFGNALVNLLTAVGVKDDEIIFTSNDAYGIPIGENIFNWLKSRITEKPHVIYLLSSDYYKSVACLNEMGAAWVVENKHTMVFTPEFDLSSPEFLNGAIDPREIGFYINNHDKLIAFIESLRMDFNISSNPVLVNQKIRAFLENIQSIVPITARKSELPSPMIQPITTKSPQAQQLEIPSHQGTNSSKSTSGTSKLLADLENDKLKDEDVLLIYYIIEAGRFKLGTGWRLGQEVENIKIWEEVQELNGLLSTNYETALRRLEMRNVTDVSEITGGGNPRELSIKAETKEELLNMSDDLLSKVNVVFERNKKTNSW